MTSVKTTFLKSLLEGAEGGPAGTTHRMSAQLESYAATCRESSVKLGTIWDDVGVPREDQEKEINDVWNSAVEVWTGAVVRAESQRGALRSRVEEGLREVDKLREELGEEIPPDSPASRARGSCESLRFETMLGGSLKTKYDSAVKMLEEWRERREARLKEFEALQEETRALKARLGHPVLPATTATHTKPDISRTNLDYLRGVLATCHSERIRKEREMEHLLGNLRKICMELGEDDVAAAASAHPSLRFYREAIPSLNTLGAGLTPTPEPPEGTNAEDTEINLCDGTLHSLELKIDELRHLRDLREQQARELMEILTNLWTALEVADHDIDRGIYKRLMEGPTRLHATSIEKCVEEVTRLENAKAQLLEDLINAKVIELQELCIETHLPMPDLTPLLGEDFDSTEGFRASETSIGQIADVLAKIVRIVTEVQVIVHHRTDTIEMILDLENSRQEIEWLNVYENDANRYKGRDCNRKLQRAIKAGKVRDKLPEKIERLREAILHWEQEEGHPFVFDDENYRTEFLDVMLRDWEQKMAERQSHRASRSTKNSSTRKPPIGRQSVGDKTPRSVGKMGAQKTAGSVTPRTGQRGYSGTSKLSSANVRTLEASQKENTIHDKVSRLLQTPSPGCDEDPAGGQDQLEFQDASHLPIQDNGVARPVVPPLLLPAHSGSAVSQSSSNTRPTPTDPGFGTVTPALDLYRRKPGPMSAGRNARKVNNSLPRPASQPGRRPHAMEGPADGASSRVRPCTAEPIQPEGTEEDMAGGAETQDFGVQVSGKPQAFQDTFADNTNDSSRARRVSM